MNKRTLGLGLLLGAMLLFTLVPHANAQVTDYNLFEEDFLTQTGPSTVTSDTWAATANLTLANSTDASTVTVTPPNQSLYALIASPTDPASYSYQATFANQASMEALFPRGSTYTYNVSGGNLGSDSGNLSFPASNTFDYPSAIPSFTNYSAFQNLNAEQAFTFTFSGFAALTGGSDQSLVFFNIYDASGAEIFSDNFLPASTTGVTVPGGTLTAGTTYTADLDYSNRQTTTDTGFSTSSGGVNPFGGLDYNTSAGFTTAAPTPEPPVTWMLLAGVMILVWGRRLRGVRLE
jgi:hypothetical protein